MVVWAAWAQDHLVPKITGVKKVNAETGCIVGVNTGVMDAKGIGTMCTNVGNKKSVLSEV